MSTEFPNLFPLKGKKSSCKWSIFFISFDPKIAARAADSYGKFIKTDESPWEAWQLVTGKAIKWVTAAK